MNDAEGTARYSQREGRQDTRKKKKEEEKKTTTVNKIACDSMHPKAIKLNKAP